jgi:hypothetical protein
MGSGRVWRWSVKTYVALVPCRVGALLYCFFLFSAQGDCRLAAEGIKLTFLISDRGMLWGLFPLRYDSKYDVLSDARRGKSSNLRISPAIINLSLC